MRKFIFEDNDSTPSSLLLKASYNGDNIIFANGGCAANILKSIERYKDCELIVFFDLPPNNEHAYRNYEKLVDIVIDREYNVHIIPILCIEYFILRFLIQCHYLPVGEKYVELVTDLVFDFNYSSNYVQDFVRVNSYRSASLEHVYKDLLITLTNKSKCMLNCIQHDKSGNIVYDSHYGIFYTADCKCEPKFCRINCSAKLQEKAEQFYTKLPIFCTVNNSHATYLNKLGIKTKEENFESLYDDVIMFFEKICSSMDIAGPLIVRFD